MNDIFDKYLPKEERGIPNEFFLRSQIICISEKDETPSNFNDNQLSIKLGKHEEEALKDVETALDKIEAFLPEATLQDKEDALDEIFKYNENPKLEDFIKVCILISVELDNKDDWIRGQLPSE